MPPVIEVDAATALTQKIHRHIPLSRSMAFTIDTLEINHIIVSAPLEPNINIHGTGFAGSIYSTAILTGWALVTHVMEELEIEAELVVGKAEIRYRAPVTAKLECETDCEETSRQAFRESVLDSGKGSLDLVIRVCQKAAEVKASFIAVAR
ncbi:MAG: YiiD C-terminal domain-containing protein [Pseudomonadota bacterium]